MNYKTLSLRYLLLIVAVVAVLLSLDSSLTKQGLVKMQHIAESPTAHLESPDANVELPTGPYACWHTVTNMNDRTTSFDRILLRRKHEVAHERHCMLPNKSIKIEQYTTSITFDLLGGHATAEALGPGLSLTDLRGFPALPSHAIRRNGFSIPEQDQAVELIGDLLISPP